MKERSSLEVPSDNSFEAQFVKREEFRVAGGVAEVADIKPENAKTDVPVFMTPGFGMNLDIQKMGLEAMVKNGRRALGLNHPRFGGDLKGAASKEELEKYPTEVLRKAFNILGVLEQKGIDKVDAVPHSDSAIVIATAAMLRPEKFRNIVFFAPAGLIGEDNFMRLVKGMASQSQRPESLGSKDFPDEIPLTPVQKDLSAAANKSFLKYFRNPVRATKEALATSRSQIQGILKDLHDKGIGIAVIAAVDDPVFPIEKMLNIQEADVADESGNIKKEKRSVKGRIIQPDMIDTFISVRGGHGEIANPYNTENSKSGAWLDLIDDTLSSLEKKKSNS